MFEVRACFLWHSAWVSAPWAAAPSGVVTFPFTDVEGSTRRWEDADGMRVALAAHDEVLRAAIEAHGAGCSSTPVTGCVPRSPRPGRRWMRRWKRSARSGLVDLVVGICHCGGQQN
jgi:hypothetical protein